jgi:hypothetical protein
MSTAETPVPGSPEDLDDSVADGAWGSVKYARRANGYMEAKQWLNAAGEGIQSKFDHLFRRMVAFGKIVNEEHFRHLGNGIWEFKRGGDRLLCFQDERCWLLTHHYAKARRKCPPSQIAHAETIRTEYFTHKR